MDSPGTLPNQWKLFYIWAGIGLQSFGGGASTTLLIQRTFIEKYKWFSAAEFAHLWNLSILPPGINLVALTILIGKKLGGVAGIFGSLAGFLLPSGIITCALTVLFQRIESVPVVQDVLKGIIPATGAVMLLVALNFAQPLFREKLKEGTFSLLISGLWIIICALAVILFNLSAIIVVLASIAVGILFFMPGPVPAPVQTERQEDGD